MANKDSKLYKYMEQNDGRLNGEVIWNASKEGDAVAKAVTDKYCEYVAQGVVNIVNIFRPEVVAIGGGVSKAGDALLKPVKEYTHKYHYGAGYSKPSEIVIAKLGNDAGIIGAAFLGK
jgi:glucokinase